MARPRGCGAAGAAVRQTVTVKTRDDRDRRAAQRPGTMTITPVMLATVNTRCHCRDVALRSSTGVPQGPRAAAVRCAGLAPAELPLLPARAAAAPARACYRGSS
jgi:hypothetical protein